MLQVGIWPWKRIWERARNWPSVLYSSSQLQLVFRISDVILDPGGMKRGNPAPVALYSRGYCMFLTVGPVWVPVWGPSTQVGSLGGRHHQTQRPGAQMLPRGMLSSPVGLALQGCYDTVTKVTTNPLAHSFKISFWSN